MGRFIADEPITSTPAMPASKTLAEQVLALLDGGNRWTTGTLSDSVNKDGRYCLIGAYAQVMVHPDWECGDMTEDAIVRYLLDEHPDAFHALERAMQAQRIILPDENLQAVDLYEWQDNRSSFKDIESLLCTAHLEELAARQLGNPTDHD